MIARVVAALLAGIALAGGARADDAPPSPKPVERADELAWKVTGSVYLAPGDTSGDLNVKRQLGSFAGWLGAYDDPAADKGVRVGLEWDGRAGPVLVVPTVQAATNGLKAAQLYCELGRDTYLIGGASRTNLKPFESLSWDPNESVQLGAGHHLSRYDKVYGFTIFDVRLHTGQQDTHLVYRHELSAKLGVTVDALYKSGHTDSGRFVRAAGIGFYVDGPRWLAKAYYDPYVNFSNVDMFRLAVGAKF